MRTLYLLYIDRDHLSDRLFIKDLAQRFSASPNGEPRTVIVHGSGEKVERTLEAEGIFVEREGGVLQVDDPAHQRLVERAVREMNQELVGTLTDEVVSAVGIQGVNRSLLTRSQEGDVQATGVGWVAALVQQRVLAVVSSLIPGEGRTAEEAPPAATVTALAQAFSGTYDPKAVVFTASGRPGLPDGADVKDTAGPDAVTDADVSEPDVVRRIATAGIPVLLTNPSGFFQDGGPKGTEIVQ